MNERTDDRVGAGAGGAAVEGAARSRTARYLAAGALVFALLALLGVWLTRDDSHEYRFVFENAGQMVTGDLVRIGGTAVGTVTAIELTDDGRAELTVSIDDEFAPLHSGTTATVRWQGLAGTANRYVDVSPAPDFKPELGDGASIQGDETTSIVEIDQLFNTLDPKTRGGLAHIIEGFSDWYGGKERQANRSARYLSPAIAAGERLFAELNRDSATLQEMLVEASKAMGAIEARSGDLTNLVDNAGATAGAIASDTESLRDAVVELPPALRQGSETFVALRGPAIDELERLVVSSEESARLLPGFLRRFGSLARRSAPVFAQLRAAFNGPGPANDLYDTMVDLPPLADSAERNFPRSRRALRQSVPIFGFIRPYAPDLMAWLRNFGGAAATYDAGGHYVRSVPVFDAFEFADDREGGTLSPKPPSQRGASANLSTGNLRRCPGAATPPPADGSAPFVDVGELANADCDPSQVLGGTP